jgi:membrane protein YqaA with SNARE-associated domain
VVGYLLGSLLIDIITPLITRLHYIDKLEIVKSWFDVYGIWIIIIAGFSPIPYKIFTIGAGIASMAFFPFVMISILARGSRFFLVAFFIKRFGHACDIWLKKYIDRLGYALVIVIGLGILYSSLQ